MIEVLHATYDEIAAEYYDPLRHPTCANFREASRRILREWLRQYSVEHGRVCEVGAGKSLLAELLDEAGLPLENVIITDSSPAMLRYSEAYARAGARLLLSSAETIPVPDGGLDLLVSSLGDPYNEPAFWNEARRALRPGGRVFFTTPAHEWAQAFRTASGSDKIMAAQFDLTDGRSVFVSSWIYPEDEQSKLVADSGLRVEKVSRVPRSALEAQRVSPKLLVEPDADLNVVTGYLVIKPA